MQILSCYFYEKGDMFQTQLLSQDIFIFMQGLQSLTLIYVHVSS